MSAPDNKQDLLDLMVAADVLRFGSFTTKGGRQTPYFINTGLYRTGAHIRKLGEIYARSIIERLGSEVDVLFGPAYKGIPLVVATAAAMAEMGHDVAYCFNRKEAKDHGEGGVMVGHDLADGDRVLIVEDITTAGTAVRETVPLLRAEAAIELAGLVVSVDRRESGPNGAAALDELAAEFVMPTWAIVNVHEIMELLPLDAEVIAAMEAYLARYGAEPAAR